MVKFSVTIDVKGQCVDCSCIEGLKGSVACVHKLAMEMALGDRPTPNLTPITYFAKKSGRPKKAANQPRY